MNTNWKEFKKKLDGTPSNDCLLFSSWFKALKLALAPDMDEEKFLHLWHFADKKTRKERANGVIKTRHNKLARYLKDLIEWLPV